MASSKFYLRNINGVIKNSKVNQSNWREELNLFLSHYRATPHDSTGVSPAKLMFKSQSSSSGLPVIFKTKGNEGDIERFAREKDFKAKEAMKKQMDKKLKSKDHDFVIGDRVYVKSAPSNKSTPRFDPEHYSIINIKGSMIEAERNDKKIVRNCSFFRKFYKERVIKDNLEPIPIIEMSSSSNILSVPTAKRSPNNSVVINSHQDSQYINFNQSADNSTSSKLDSLNMNDKFQDDHEIKLSEGENQGVDDSIRSKKLNNDDDLLSVGELSDVDISVDNEEEVSEGEIINKDLNEKVLRQKRIRKPPNRYSDLEENERAKLLKEKQRINTHNLIDSIYSALN